MIRSPAISHRVKQHPDNPQLIHSVSVYVSKIIASNVPYDIMCSDSCYPLEGRLLTLSEVLTWHNTIVLITCLSLVVLWTMLFYVCTGCRLKFIHFLFLMISHKFIVSLKHFLFCRNWKAETYWMYLDCHHFDIIQCAAVRYWAPKSSKQGYLVSHHTWILVNVVQPLKNCTTFPGYSQQVSVFLWSYSVDVGRCLFMLWCSCIYYFKICWLAW